ncbi:MAG TPA: MlaD family protein, partial [Bacteroidia bacterium]|nr:MlaD family protein [Bacteroidia bacterium]
MDKEIRNNIVVGAFVSIGMALLIVGVYFVGAKKNLFSSTFTIVAEFTDINGLQDGDNVRFRGLDVGTIKNIEVNYDSIVIVTLTIENKMRPFIKKNAFVSIGTDGLMGNKLAIVHNGATISKDIEEGDTILAINPMGSEDIIRSLGGTSKNIAV